MQAPPTSDRKPRQQWMSALAKAAVEQLEDRVAQLGALPSYDYLRSPELGLAMVQGRAGGTGQPFYLGEITVSRCVVRLQASASPEAIAGFGYVSGRSLRHAELAALCDALLQQPDWHPRVWETVIAPLQAETQRQQQQQQRQAEATRVNFFTMVRGES